MISRQHTILFVSSDKLALRAASKAFGKDNDFRLIKCEDEQAANAKILHVNCELIFCDEAVLSDERDNFLVSSRVRVPHAQRIVFGDACSASRVQDIARDCSAFLFLTTPLMSAQLAIVVRRALEMEELSRRYRLLSRELRLSIDDDFFADPTLVPIQAPWSRFEKLIYVSPKMDKLCASARQAAATELPVLIHGETGTGKELLARAVHYNSARRESPMLVQNCGGIADEALHSELFGHVRGAFAGALSDRLGLFRAAGGGTVFLDEVSEISLNFQAGLLRFLQEGEVRPLGAENVQHSDVRIIAASNRALDKLVAEGSFRKDLYYRLKGFQLDIPPLRERLDDIPALANYFLECASEINNKRILGISREALNRLAAYDFPGNARELEMEISRAAALATNNGYITPKHFSESISQVQPEASSFNSFGTEGKTLKETIEAMESQIVLQVLKRSKWNQSRAAAVLGLSRVGIANKIKRYGLDKEESA